MVFRKVPNYIVKARASYQLVRGVPSDCQAKVGKKKWKEGGGKTINEARAKLPAFLARTDSLIAQARAEQLTNEELVIRQGDVEGWSAVVLAQEANPHVAERFDDGSYNPEFESMVAMAEAVKAGKANALLSTQGLLQARRLDREPAPRTFEGWVMALHAFMAFTGKSKPFQCTRADALSYKDALLTRMSRGSAKTQLACLAGLWTTLVEKQGIGDHIFKGLPGTLDETTKSKALRAATAKRNQSFEPVIPYEQWSGSIYVPVFQLLYFTGARLSEVAGLRAEDIHETPSALSGRRSRA